MTTKQKNIRTRTKQDHPIPIETIQDVNTKFDIIRENIEILWNRLKLLSGASISDSGITDTNQQDVPPDPGTPGGTTIINNYYIDQKKAAIYDEEGGVDITSDWSDIKFDSHDDLFNTGVFSHSLSGSEVRVNENGDYEIIVEVGVKSIADNGQVYEIRLVRDNGFGFEEIPGSRTYCKI